MHRVMFVCHGNICRSTMAESVLNHLVIKMGVDKDFIIDSSATSTEEIGNPLHYGTVKKLEEENIKAIPHFAKQLSKKDLEKFDYFIGMDDANIKNMIKILGTDKGVYKLKGFINDKSDVKDPWYTGNFDETYDDISKSLIGFLKYLGY